MKWGKNKKHNYTQISIRKNLPLYLFLVPAIVFTIVFSYIPMGGISMAFLDYNIFSGSNPIDSFFKSDFIGLENFRLIFAQEKFWEVLGNTLEISLLKIVFLFPLPIILAIMLNEIFFEKLKKLFQTILYLPHFLSWVIVAGIWLSILGGAGGVNNFLINNGFVNEPIQFLLDDLLFRFVLLFSDSWKEIGWSAIIYLAAITGIDSNLYEAARIDGANKLQEILYITIPSISSTIMMMFILRISGIMDAGFDQIFNLYSVFVYKQNDILSTYLFRTGLGEGQYSFAAAIGLFNSIIGFILMMSANKLTKKYSGKSIW